MWWVVLGLRIGYLLVVIVGFVAVIGGAVLDIDAILQPSGSSGVDISVLPQSLGEPEVSLNAPPQLLLGSSRVDSQASLGVVVRFSDSTDSGISAEENDPAVASEGLAPVWPFRGIIDFGRAEDGEFVLRFWNTESGRIHDVPLGAVLEGEPCWHSTSAYSSHYDFRDHGSDIYGYALYATEEFVLTQFGDSSLPVDSHTRWSVVVPWDDQAYPVAWPEVLVGSEFGLGQLPLSENNPSSGRQRGFGLGQLPLGEGFEMSYIANGHFNPKGVISVTTPDGQAYYDWDAEFLDYDLYTDEYPKEIDAEVNSECERIYVETLIGIELELGEPPPNPVDYSQFSSSDDPYEHDDYNEWLRGAPKARFDGTDGYHYGFTIIFPSWEAGPGVSQPWSFVVAGDTGEVIACRKMDGAAGPLLVKPEDWPGLIDRFVPPEVFSGSVFSGSTLSGSGCASAGELLNLPSG